MTADSCD